MRESALKPRILIVDDNEMVGRHISRFIESLFECEVFLPQTATEMVDAAEKKAFDSVLVDADLSQWKQLKIFGKPVADGIEFARRYCELQPKSLIVILGADLLPGGEDRIRERINSLSSCNVKEIKSPFQQEAKEEFQVLRPESEEELRQELPRIEEIHQENPIFQPLTAFANLPSDERRLRSRLLYRRACEWVGNWMNSNLHDAGDSSWTLLCDGDVQKQYYGELLNGRTASPKVTIRTRYPLREERQEMARTAKTNPLIFWNTWNTSILTKQFEGRRLKKIKPANLGDEFGIAVAPACARAYNDGQEETVIDWCNTLAGISPSAQLDTLKAIYTSLNSDRERSVSAFANRCQNAGIIRVVDIYTANVEEIMPRKNTAMIELRNRAGDDVFVAPFDFGNLVQKGIKETGQQFEYTVYADIHDNAGGQIELID